MQQRCATENRKDPEPGSSSADFSESKSKARATAHRLLPEHADLFVQLTRLLDKLAIANNNHCKNGKQEGSQAGFLMDTARHWEGPEVRYDTWRSRKEVRTVGAG